MSEKTYKTSVTMTKDEFNQVNNLLSIEEIGLDPVRDTEYGAKCNEDKLLFSNEYPDGVILCLYLRSGMHNYFLDPIFFVKGVGEIDSDEAGFSLDEDNKFVRSDTHYLVHINLEDSHE